jgi:carboxyl-terminal processing protease
MAPWLRAPIPTKLRLALACAVAASLFLLAGPAPQRAALAPSIAPAAASSGELAPSERHRRVLRLVSEVVERQHYRQAELDDSMSSLIFERYLEALDGNRSYFLATDIAEFEPLRYQLDDAIQEADAGPAFQIFTRYQERNREVLRYAITLLNVEPDFTIDESFRFDRTEEGWPASGDELHELWRKRVKDDALRLMLQGKTWAEASDMLRKRYERVTKRIEQVTADDVFETFMNAYSHVYDPHSNYLSPRNSEEYNIAMSLSYEGIGASLQLVDDYVTIMNLLPGGSAAASSEIKVGDRITAVGQGEAGALTDVVGWRLDDVVQLIRGPENSLVRLQILPASGPPVTQEAQVTLMRTKITLESQAAKKEVHTLRRGDEELRVGVISVPSFYQDFQARMKGEAEYRSTTRDVHRLVDELKAEGIDSLVIDLRDNGGGHLSEATSLVGLFVERGPVVQLRETSGRIEVLDDPEPGVAWDGPLVVLVNRASASASEIFAGAIQDYQRGLVVGQQTYGKGSVQNLYPLDRYALGPNAGFGQLTVTIGKYYRVTGDSTQHRGVEPDITLPSLLDTGDIGESTRESALPWDRINAARYTPEPGELPVVAMISREHEERVAHNPDFVALQGDVDALAQLRSQRDVSLNLEKRRAERDAIDAERLKRENARRAARGLEPLADVGALDDAEAPDAVLDEAVEIAADAAQLPKLEEPARLS